MLISEMELFQLFSQCSNWQERYRQIIQLAKQLPNFPEQDKCAEHLVSGCENQVWISYQQQPDGKFYFYGDSEGRIVKGLLSILFILVNGKTAQQISMMNFNHYFQQLKITEELSQSRQIGLQKLVERVQKIIEV